MDQALDRRPVGGHSVAVTDLPPARPWVWRTSGSVELVVPSPPHAVYDVISDVTRIGERSPECYAAHWLPGATPGTVGAQFQGDNDAGRLARWSRRCEVLAAEPGRVFAFRTVPARQPYTDSTTWRYDLEPVDGGTRVRHSYEITRPPALPLRAVLGLTLSQHRDMRQQMQVNLEALRDQFAAAALPAGEPGCEEVGARLSGGTEDGAA